jgi:hypothetical protein
VDRGNAEASEVPPGRSPLDGWLVDLMEMYLTTTPERAGKPDAVFPNRRKGGDMPPGTDGPTPARRTTGSSPIEPGSLLLSLSTWSAT